MPPRRLPRNRPPLRRPPRRPKRRRRRPRHRRTTSARRGSTSPTARISIPRQRFEPTTRILTGALLQARCPGAAANFQGCPSDTAIKGAAVEPHSPVTEGKVDDKLDNVGRGSVRLFVLRWLCSRAVGKKRMATRAYSHSQLG